MGGGPAMSEGQVALQNCLPSGAGGRVGTGLIGEDLCEWGFAVWSCCCCLELDGAVGGAVDAYVRGCCV